MNDELTGQLTETGYTLPAYLQDSLWLVTEADTVQTEGSAGLFQLTVPAQALTLHLAGETGAAVARLPWEPDTLGWRGHVAVGGRIESISVREFNGIPISVLGVIGHPLTAGAIPYSLPIHRKDPDYLPPTFSEGKIPDVDEGFYTYLVPEESTFAAMAETALLNRVPVWLWGRVASDKEGWANAVALPLILEEMSIFTDL